MNKEEARKRLEEAQKLPVATADDLQNIPQGITKKKLNTYLKDFVKPEGKCWQCENRLIVEWGIQHGVAHCTTCGIDVKMYHYFEDSKGNKHRIELALQYHPKHYSINEEETINDGN
ncbi:hypothetical protein [Ornithinibacillus sp. JPR2-1]|uniref:hypothetical protein n=1 Tax=Ornithinibacillus sp. JPR2-1 TaxID=2094019 RepID=UPI0031D38CF0